MRRFLISSDDLTGFLKTGPSPSENSNSKPSASGIVRISENNIAASISNP